MDKCWLNENYPHRSSLPTTHTTHKPHIHTTHSTHTTHTTHIQPTYHTHHPTTHAPCISHTHNTQIYPQTHPMHILHTYTCITTHTHTYTPHTHILPVSSPISHLSGSFFSPWSDSCVCFWLLCRPGRSHFSHSLSLHPPGPPSNERLSVRWLSSSTVSPQTIYSASLFFGGELPPEHRAPEWASNISVTADWD